jgi:uncharacterized protein
MSNADTGNRNFYFSVGNRPLVVSRCEFASIKVPEALNGYKIIHISDLHNHAFGKDQSEIVSKISDECPNVIFITGDLIDRRHTDIDTAMNFIKRAVDISRVYFVSGNHEELWAGRAKLYSLLKDAGVILLDNSSAVIKKNGCAFRVFGLPDPSVFGSNSDTVSSEVLEASKEMLRGLISENSPFIQILLTHRPDLIKLYSECGADLVFTGHAHGGQIRLPLIGGLYAPGQGIFPRLTSGMHMSGNTTMVISRGLGNSLFPLRVFNPPEIVSLKLVHK